MIMSDSDFSTWTNDKDKAAAFERAAGAYDNNSLVHVNRTSALYDRTFLNVEPGKSVRPSFDRGDYNSFRTGESVPVRQKRVIRMCMDAYDRVGLVKNIIDLMGDFGSQGISIVHPNKAIERFHEKWFIQVGGVERSERFLNYLFRTGNVFVKRRTAKINAAKEAELKRASGADVEVQTTKYAKREIPWGYDFLNPLAIDVLDQDAGNFIGQPTYIFNVSTSTYNAIRSQRLPDDIKQSLQNGNRKIVLDKEKLQVFHYKKDDWMLWANPMTYAILDDLIMLEKMKLADLAALDGAISQIRLWTLGNLEFKIIPNRAMVERLQSILASNTGGGTMDLVWGPELTFKESDSQVYKFLGSEKYGPVLTAIYGGLGVPQSLTGSSAGGGFTNNYVSLKTLIERLEYGRQLLTQFWQKELEIVQKAMGFRFPAQIRFDSIVLSDEAAEKQLLINLADREIISHETVVERFGEIPEIERIRVRREEQARRSDDVIPKKASPFHNPNIRNDVAKVLVTKDALDDSYYDSLDLPKIDVPPPPVAAVPGQGNPKKPKKSNPQGGRPTGVKDSTTRKQKRVLPKAGKSAAILWAYNAQKTIAEQVTPMMLSFYDKKNVRSLTKAEFDQLEHLKLCLLTGIEPFVELSAEVIQRLIQESHKPTYAFLTEVRDEIDNFVYTNKRKPTVDEMKFIYAGAYINEVFNEDI